MELNFNSVEMSSKPSAEVSSLDYAEAPLTFNSVETIPVLNASAAFKTDSGKVFKEDVLTLVRERLTALLNYG